MSNIYLIIIVLRIIADFAKILILLYQKNRAGLGKLSVKGKIICILGFVGHI